MRRDRRRQRSKQLRKAITYQFQHVEQEYGIHHFTLADSRGLLVASGNDGRSTEILAAYAPLFSRLVDPLTRRRMYHSLSIFAPEIEPADVTVRSFNAGGEPLYLLAVGERGARRNAGVYRAISGVRRILAN